MTVLINTLAGNLSIGTDAATPVFTDVSSYVTNFTIGVAVDQVEVAQTMATDKTSRPGPKVHTITLNYYNDPGTAALFNLLYDAAVTGTGYLNFTANTFDGVTSATNPEWSGKFIVSGAETGGEMGALGATSATFTLTAAPTKAIS